MWTQPQNLVYFKVDPSWSCAQLQCSVLVHSLLGRLFLRAWWFWYRSSHSVNTMTQRQSSLQKATSQVTYVTRFPVKGKRRCVALPCPCPCPLTASSDKLYLMTCISGIYLWTQWRSTSHHNVHKAWPVETGSFWNVLQTPAYAEAFPIASAHGTASRSLLRESGCIRNLMRSLHKQNLFFLFFTCG